MNRVKEGVIFASICVIRIRLMVMVRVSGILGVLAGLSDWLQAGQAACR